MILGFIKNITKTNDKNFTEVISHSFWAFFILVLATGIQFTFDLLLAQSFGARGYGIFYLAFTIIITLATIGRLGLDRAVVRFIPDLIAKQRNERAHAVMSAAVTSSLLLTVPMALALFLLSDYLANVVFNEPVLSMYLKTFAVAIPPFSLSYVYSGVLKSVKKTRAALFLERLSVYGIGIASIFTLGSVLGLEGVVIGITVGCIFTAILGFFMTERAFNVPLSLRQHFSKRKLLAVAGPLLFVMFATQMNGQASVLILGGLSDATDVGVFNVALKVSMLMSLVITAITTITATKISELYHGGRKDELSLVLSKTSVLGAITALPLLVVMLIAPQFLLGLFGEEFIVGYATLIVLAIGQYINVAVGTTVFALGLTDREKPLAFVVGAGLVLNVTLGFLLVPTLGTFGAGIATSVTIATTNIAMVYLVKRYLGVWLLPFEGISSLIRTVSKRR